MRQGREITHDMFRLWYLAEGDLLSASVPYTLRNTGQGLQRVQQSPRTYKAMQGVLQSTQSKLGSWVGSSMIHMGDHNVPNALSFIDKYTQVARILNPIIITLETLAQLYKEDDGIKSLIDSGFGGMKKVRRDILCDFFRSAFDGSGGACARRPPSAPCFAFPPRAHISHHGMECAMTDDGPPCALPSHLRPAADNNYDAGSCIDGRLTSAWNWCSQLPTKPFAPLFALTGFQGFDGDFA
jgi:hypothetical protein